MTNPENNVGTEQITPAAPPTQRLRLSLAVVVLITSLLLNAFLIFKTQFETPKNRAPLSDETPVADTISTETIEPTYVHTKPVERIEFCDGKQCLFTGPDAVEGLGTLTGYFTTYTKSDWGDGEITCDALYVLDGSKPLVDNLISWVVDEGNNVNRVSDDNHLILNLELAALTPQEQAKIKASSATSPLSLTVVRGTPIGRGAGSCESFVEILRVN